MSTHTAALIAAAFCIFLPIALYSQDCDGDGINDILEHKLALKFAPEWRFNHRVFNDASQQNNNEVALPSSVEWFHHEVVGMEGHYPQLCFYDQVCGNCPLSGERCKPIYDMNEVSAMTDPKTGYRADDDYWKSNPKLVKISRYSKWIGGYPENFPTYYHCSNYGAGTIGIEYYLWFPWDYPGSYTSFDIVFGEHRGDWENITVVIRGVFNLNEVEVPASAAIEKVIYYGHFTPGKEVSGMSLSHLVDGTHPQAFVAWGTHAIYPEPGEWHNAKTAGPNVYDDFFHGNGYVVKSWFPSRELINLGKYDHPLTGWLRFQGQFGPDGDVEQGSPRSPVFRNRWGSPGNPLNTREIRSWESIKAGYSEWWENPPELDGQTPVSLIVAEGPPRVELYKDDHWRGASASLGAQNYPSIYLIDGEVSSALLLGGARVILFSGANFGGQSFELTHSCPDLKQHYNHDFGDKARSAIVVAGSNHVYVDRVNAAGYQDGAALRGTLSGPYSTIGRALFHVTKGGVITVRGGNYPEILTLDKSVTINVEGGPVVIGRFDQ
jgi:hypothetical protein